MEDVYCKTILEVTQEDKAKIRNFFNISDPIKIEESLNALEEWIQKQDHLIEGYQYIDRSFIEHLLLLAGGSREMTKIKIDKVFTTRGMLSELVLNRSYEEFDKCWDHFHFVPLPKLNPLDQTRCVVAKIIRENYDEVSMLTLFRYLCMISEFRIYLDYMQGDRYIWDFQNISITVLSKLNPFLLKKLAILLTEAYDSKLKGVYFINSPPFVDKIFSMMKPFLKEKLASRFHIHSSYEDLYKDIPREILPEDFGGEAPKLSKLSEQWKVFLNTEKSRTLIDNLNKITSDESKRSSVKFNEEYLGMPGSFRQMTVD